MACQHCRQGPDEPAPVLPQMMGALYMGNKPLVHSDYRQGGEAVAAHEQCKQCPCRTLNRTAQPHPRPLSAPRPHSRSAAIVRPRPRSIVVLRPRHCRAAVVRLRPCRTAAVRARPCRTAAVRARPPPCRVGLVLEEFVRLLHHCGMAPAEVDICCGRGHIISQIIKEGEARCGCPA